MKYEKILYIFILFYDLKCISDEIIHLKLFKNYQTDIDAKNYISKLKKVVYTVLIGKYDKFNIINKEKGYDYFMLTDQILKNESNLNWTILPLKRKNESIIAKIFKRQRFYKIYPHLFFKNYDLSIYVDASYEIKGNLDEFLLRILSPNISIYVMEHPYRKTIVNEIKAVLASKKDTNISLTKIKNIYKVQKFPDNKGLSENSLIIRKHNDMKCINFMEKWFNEIKNYSHRDQLSFGYIFWKTGDKIIKYISRQFIFKYFHKNEHLKKIRFK